ncbi:MAG: hypothetical protein E7230_05620 [Clostridiales bacterium]|nr:hypothetical protein [Clostridiales bacterium]MBR0469120.1 hypothetical protein [Mogibacterium sp.]
MNIWDLIYDFSIWIAKIHDRVLRINDAGGWYFDDKQLHFIVIGVFGMLLLFVLYPIFKWLAKRDHTMVITWLYVFTLVLVFSFAIEIGQWWTGTGSMEGRDIAYGVAGFLVMFLIFALLRALYHAIRDLTERDKRPTKVYSRDMFDK